MSKLLSALAQSDAQRTSATVSSGAAYRRGPVPKQANTWLLPGLGFALPVIGILGYLSLQPQQADVKVQQVVAATVAIPEIAQPVAVPVSVSDTVLPPVAGVVSAAHVYPQDIEPLDYPQLYTEPLPSQARGSQRSRYSQAQTSPLPAVQASGWDSEPVPVDRPVERTVGDSWDLEALDYSELSPELASQLRSAIAATGDGETLPQLLQEERLPPMPEPQEPMAAVSIGELPTSVQDRIPALNFQTHIYSSTPNSRWVKVNGSEAYEGDEIAPGVTLRRIDPREVVFDFESYLISMPALSEW